MTNYALGSVGKPLPGVEVTIRAPGGGGEAVGEICVRWPNVMAGYFENAEATAEVGLVRFHGRNAEAWARPGASVAERFDYLYSDEELAEWQPRIERLAEQTEELHLLMNNCHEDKAVRGARQLGMLLGRAGGPPPEAPQAQQRTLF